MSDLLGRDCTRIDPAPDEEDREWLTRLARAVRAKDHLLAFSDGPRDDDELVYCERDGTWWCGRYVGTIAFEGRRLTIAPRFGLDTLGHWLEAALDLRFTDTSGDAEAHEAFLPQLLARLWGNSIVRASRHGLPGLRVDVRHHGLVARGRIDVRRTIAERVRGHPGISSVQRERSLDNAIVHAIVAAHGALHRRLGGLALRRLIPERARDVLTAFAGINPSKRAPEPVDVANIRFTPITMGYRSLVKLSVAIARNQGLLADANPNGEASGILVDVAEIWELFVLECLRRAYPQAAVVHGTTELIEAGRLLTNVAGLALGHLFPDAIASAEATIVVADAKYKSLQPSSGRPSGVNREDLYQMRAYLSHWSDARLGMLLFPREAGAEPFVLSNAPWHFDDDRELRFVWLPITLEGAVNELALQHRVFDTSLEARSPTPRRAILP